LCPQADRVVDPAITSERPIRIRRSVLPWLNGQSGRDALPAAPVMRVHTAQMSRARVQLSRLMTCFDAPRWTSAAPSRVAVAGAGAGAGAWRPISGTAMAILACAFNCEASTLHCIQTFGLGCRGAGAALPAVGRGDLASHRADPTPPATASDPRHRSRASPVHGAND